MNAKVHDLMTGSVVAKVYIDVREAQRACPDGLVFPKNLAVLQTQPALRKK